MQATRSRRTAPASKPPWLNSLCAHPIQEESLRQDVHAFFQRPHVANGYMGRCAVETLRDRQYFRKAEADASVGITLIDAARLCLHEVDLGFAESGEDGRVDVLRSVANGRFYARLPASKRHIKKEAVGKRAGAGANEHLQIAIRNLKLKLCPNLACPSLDICAYATYDACPES